jgi:hypothetical protein
MSKEDDRKKKKKKRESIIEKELYSFLSVIMRPTINKVLDDLLKDFK